MGRLIIRWAGFLVMLAGVIFLGSPFLRIAMEDLELQRNVAAYYKQLAAELQAGQNENQNEKEAVVPLPEEADSESGSAADFSERQKMNEAFYKDAVSYNESLMHGGQDALNSENMKTFDLDLRDYGHMENIIGIMEIPRLGKEFALFLGADDEYLMKGATVFGKTSVPLGRGSECTAIAGHRGTIFRYIQMMQIGDPIYLSTYFGNLTYRVSKIEIVLPDDNNWCYVKEGTTQIVLMTCHPYGIDDHRYLVYAELSDEEKPSKEQIEEENKRTYDPNAREISIVNEDGSETTVLLDPEGVEGESASGLFWSDLYIKLENMLKPIAIAASLLLLIIGIWLVKDTAQEVRERKMRSEEDDAE